MRNPKKFGSPKLDTPSLRYEFLKHAFKSGKINQKIKHHTDWQPGPAVNKDPLVSETKTMDGTDRWELTDGKVSSGSVFTTVPSSSTRIEW